jgi:hypothetical protein
MIAGQATGNPIWQIFKNSSFLLPGAGPQIGVGPVYVRANERITIKVTGSLPLSSVSGTIWGTISTISQGDDLPLQVPQVGGTFPVFNPSARLSLTGIINAPTVKQAPFVLIAALSALQGFTFNISPGMQEVSIWLVNQSGTSSQVPLVLTGITTSYSYFNGNAPSSGANTTTLPTRVLVDYAFEPQLQLTVDNSLNNSAITLFITGGQNSVEVVEAQITDSVGGSILANKNGSLQVVESGPGPLGRRTFGTTTGGIGSGVTSATLLTFTAVGYLYGIEVSTDTNVNANACELQNLNNNILAKGAQPAGAQGKLIQHNGAGAVQDSSGANITGLKIKNTGGVNTNFYLSVSYTNV